MKHSPDTPPSEQEPQSDSGHDVPFVPGARTETDSFAWDMLEERVAPSRKRREHVRPRAETDAGIWRWQQRRFIFGLLTFIITAAALVFGLLSLLSRNHDLIVTPTPQEAVWVGDTIEPPTETPTPTITPTVRSTLLPSFTPTQTITGTPPSMTPMTTLVPANFLPPTHLSVALLPVNDLIPTATLAFASRPSNGSAQVELPSGGACVVATLRNYAVNIRAEPSTGAAVSGTILPTEMMPVTGHSTRDGIVWYQVADGWIAGYVARLGGDCGGIPVSDGVVPAVRPPAPNTGPGSMADNFVPTDNDLEKYRYILFQDGSIWYNPRFQ